MASAKLIRQVADYCWSNKFIEIFRNYFRQHADLFLGAPEICSGEHNMQYYALFQDYLKLYEDTLTNYLSSLDVPIEEFYQEVREFQGRTDDPYLKLFVDCLLASADYESFYKVMWKEGRKLASPSPRSVGKIGLNDAKADVKSAAVGGAAEAKSPARAAGAGSKDADFDADRKGAADDIGEKSSK